MDLDGKEANMQAMNRGALSHQDKPNAGAGFGGVSQQINDSIIG